MPTPYTNDLCKKDIPFEKFVLNCARACVGSMRDSSGPLPERFKPSDHYEKEIRQDQAKLAALKAMTDGQAEAAAEKDYEKALKDHEQYVLEVKKCRERLMAMRTKVAGWQPSRDHEGLQKFMLDQLDDTIERDGQVLEDSPEKKSAKAWKAEKVASLKDDIAYNQEAQRKAIRDAENDTLWVERLRDNLEALARDRAPIKR